MKGEQAIIKAAMEWYRLTQDKTASEKARGIAYQNLKAACERASR